MNIVTAQSASYIAVTILKRLHVANDISFFPNPQDNLLRRVSLDAADKKRAGPGKRIDIQGLSFFSWLILHKI